MALEFSPATAQRARRLVERYPKKEGAILPVLYLAQQEFGHLSLEAIQCVARFLELPPARIYGLVSFYTMLYTRPMGRYHIQVCRTLPCALAGADRLIEKLEQSLGIRSGETTPDGMFTLSEVECLASCGTAPVAQINEDYYEQLTEERVTALLEELRQKA
jgi:NADH-quinone oxidoreductase subunit E